MRKCNRVRNTPGPQLEFWAEKEMKAEKQLGFNSVLNMDSINIKGWLSLRKALLYSCPATLF